MVVTVHIDRSDITRILIDKGSQAKILFLLALKNGLWLKEVERDDEALYGFGDKRIEPVGVITFLV
jgi:hypothetical protein